MKLTTILIGLFGVIIGGTILANNNLTSVETYEKQISATTTIEVFPEWAEDTDAVEAAKAVIRKKELEAELEEVNSGIESLEVRKAELEKELGTY